MASGIAARRFKKAIRRKAQVAEKRKLERLEETLPAQVRRALAGPIRHCVLQEALFEQGMGTLVVARGVTAGRLTVGAFLLDAYCLGIKDIVFYSLDAQELELLLEKMDDTAPLTRVDPAYARKLLRDLAAWSSSIGFAPHRDFAAVEQLLGDVNADACDVVFRFGLDGKPCYMPGPTDSPALVNARREQLRKRRGDEEAAA